MEISWTGLRRTPRGYAVADLAVSIDGVVVKYSVYLRSSIRLVFQSADRGRAELAAQLLRRMNVSAEVKEVGNVWCVQAYTDVLAAGREELRRALAEVVKEATKRGWVSEKRAEKWLKKLEKGRALREGWPKYEVRQSSGGALTVKFGSTNSGNIMWEVQRLRDIGLEEGRHFSVEMPREGYDGYVYVRREGLVYAAWLSVHGSGRRRELAAAFVEHILQRAKEAGEEVYEKAKEIVEEGMSRGSLTLKGFEKEVEVDGKTYVVKVISGGAELEEGRSGRLLLRIEIVTEVNGVKCEYEIVFGRYGKKKEVAGYATTSADAPGGREADAGRLTAVIEALAGRKPRVYRKKNGAVVVVCGRRHLEGFRRFKELAEAIERWLSQ